MAWTAKQIKMACTAAGQAGVDRHMVLSQRPTYGNRAMHQGRITMKSPKLTPEDFEHFMWLCEMQCDGQLLGQQRGYWHGRAGDGKRNRLRHRARMIDQRLQKGYREWLPDGRGLAGWIFNVLTHGRTAELEDLDERELMDLVDGLTDFAKRNGVKIPAGDTAEAHQAPAS